MAEINISEAAMAGVRLTSKKPLTVLTWGALIVGYLALLLALFGVGLVNSIVAIARNAGGQPEPQQVFAMLGSLFSFIGLLLIGMLVIGTVVRAAAIRSELDPAKGSFAYMRFGGQELWVLGANIVLGLTLAVVGMVLAIPLGILTMAMGFQAAAGSGFTPGSGGFGQALSGLIGIRLIGQLIIQAVGIWLWCRLAPGIVMTFRERQFRLFESWNLTKGHAWRIFLAMLLVWLMLAAMVIVAYIIIAAVAFGTIFTAPGITDPTTFFSRPPADWMGIFGPAALVAALLFVVVTGVSSALQWAALSRIYLQLQPPSEVAETFA